MKLKLVAVAVTSLLAAGVVNAAEVYNKDGNKLDLYGKVHAQHYFSDDNGSDGDKTYARLGFKGETQINDQLTGFGQWEYEFKGNRTESQGADKDKTRLAFAGLKFADYGSFDYGRNYGVAYDIGAWTDVLPEFGGDTWTQTDVFMTGRTTGVATYRNTDFFGLVEGLNFAAQYQGKNDRDGAYESNGDGFGLSATYEYEGFGVGAAYAKSDRTNNQVKAASNLNAAGKNAEVWAAGLKYDANMLGSEDGGFEPYIKLWREAQILADRDPHIRDAYLLTMQMWHEETVTIIEQGKQAGEFTFTANATDIAWRLIALVCGLDGMYVLGIPEMADPAFKYHLDRMITLELFA